MRLDHRPVYVVRLTRTVISNGAHQAIEFGNPIRVLYPIRPSRSTRWPAQSVIGQAGEATIFALSEAGSADIRRAHAAHPVSALQSEYSAPSNGRLPHRYCNR
jgi:aryl-alcohol dehydrogenase-like predicted oxidoreductase